MPSEQEQLFCIQKTSLLQDNVSDRPCVPISDVTIEKSTSEPTISDILAYGLKNVKVELPRVNIPDETISKHEINKYMKLFQCKENPVGVSFMQMDVNGSNLRYSEIYTPFNKSGLHYEEGLKTSAKILNFSCTKCQNTIRYSPNDLQKHFQLLHQGELPTYPCEMCNFSASDFQSFNQHRRTHRSTLVKCEICNDDHIYTLLDLTKHFASKHCVNGHFQCERCRFSTLDVGTFVQHIHRHNEIQYNCEKCDHVSFSKEEFQKHNVSHAGIFPFSCQYCNFMASQKTYLLKHIITLHRDHLYAKDKIDADDNEKRMKTSTGLKLILKRYKTGASRKALWRRKKFITDGCRTEEEEKQILKDTKESQPKSEKFGQSVKEVYLNEDHILLNEKHPYSGVKPSQAVQYNRTEDGCAPGLIKNAFHGPAVLMIKNNKISVPANYSAKFMGFKMVDGKQHIVIKLLPTDKQNLLAGGKVDSLAECQEETADNSTLSLVSERHEINQSPRNNTVHSLPSSVLSNQFSGKIKQESTSSLCCSTSQNTEPLVGKCATYLPVKSETSSVPCDLVVKTGRRDPFSQRNCIPQDHPQISSTAGSHMLHYDPMKKPFPPEFRVVNGEVNNTIKPNNLCWPSTDFSNQAPLPFHNYSILDKSKDLTYSKTFPLQNRPINETMSFSQSVTGLNLDKKSLLPLYGFVNTNNVPVFSASQPTYSIDRQCWIDNHHDGQLYLNTRVNQVQHVAENSKQENDSNSENSSPMPKITSVFSLQSKQASNYLSPEVNQSLQDVLKGPPSIQSHNYIKTNDQSFSDNHKGCKTFTHATDPTAWCRLMNSSNKLKRELNVNGTATNESIHLRNERQISMPIRTEALNSASRITGIGSLLKSQTDSIITQQLAKDKMHYNIHEPNNMYPTYLEQKKSMLLQSTSPKFFVPLHFAHKQGLQVVSGKPSPKMSSSDSQASRTATTSLLLNKGPGMILTFGREPGTAANVIENNTQVLEKCAFKEYNKEAVSSEMELKTNYSRSLKNSINKQLNITNPESKLSSVKIHAGFHSSKAACVESAKQPEIGQEQPVYALLPNGRQAVFLKCMSPNKSFVQNHSVFQSHIHSQNSEPKKSGAMQQKLFLKIKTFPATEKCQPVSKFVQLNNMHSSNSPALNQKNTALSSINALLLTDRLKPANACSANEKSKDLCTSFVNSSRDALLQKTLPDSSQTVIANKGNDFGSQMATESMTKISKAKRHSKQNSVKVSKAPVSQKNKNLKRKTKDDYLGPPRKKTLHRKCKEKNQVDVNEFEPLFQVSYSPRVSKDTIRILNLLPFNSKQLVKCPRRNQPVVVLNHPDADVPEVVNVMKTIAKFKGHVLKVSLSKRTIDALLEPAYTNSLYIITNELSRRKRKMLKPVSPVKERFVLKLTLKKTSKNNYQIVKTTSDKTLKTKFSCWFCGRIFDNQDNWVGHGQRHLMEATRDWNSLD